MFLVFRAISQKEKEADIAVQTIDWQTEARAFADGFVALQCKEALMWHAQLVQAGVVPIVDQQSRDEALRLAGGAEQLGGEAGVFDAKFGPSVNHLAASAAWQYPNGLLSDINDALKAQLEAVEGDQEAVERAERSRQITAGVLEFERARAIHDSTETAEPDIGPPFGTVSPLKTERAGPPPIPGRLTSSALGFDLPED